MRTRHSWRPKPKPPQLLFRINHHIRVPELVVIDETGHNLGVLPTSQALALAEEHGFDLVEVFPKGTPPVAKLLNYGQLQYEEQKKKRLQKAKQKNFELKGIRLSLRIGKHDLENRLHQAEEFLQAGHPIKIELPLRGRERNYGATGRQQIGHFAQQLKHLAEAEEGVQDQFGRLSLTLRPTKKLDQEMDEPENKKSRNQEIKK